MVLRAGIGISAGGGDQIPGKLKIQQPFIIPSGGTYTGAIDFLGGKLGCIEPTTGQFFVTDCMSVAATQTYFGVNQAAAQTNGALVQTEGVTLVQSASTTPRFIQGDVVCTDPSNAAVVVRNGSNPCPYPTVRRGA
jgi:hypothetical protein